MDANTLPNKYPCPICHTLYCDHWIGFTWDRATLVPRDPERPPVPAELLDTDTVFHAGLTMRVYRRQKASGIRGRVNK